MGRRPCCSKEGLNRGAWSAREDQILVEYIKTHGEGKWRDLPRKAGLKRCGKSCRLRWLNYLRPDIKRGNISGDEEELIIRLHSLLGNRWSLIAGRIPGRTDNEIKNYWNTNLSKRVHGSSPRPSGAQRRLGKHEEKSKAVEPQPPGGGVIRTKATRCTKVFFPAALHETAAGAKQLGEDLDFKCQKMSSPASPLREDNESFCNILLELNIDELMSSTEELDFLRTPGGTGDQDASKNVGEDKSAVCGGGGGDGDGDGDGDGEEYMSPLPDHLFVSEEAILEEWRECLMPVEVTSVDACLYGEEWVEQQCEL